MTIHAPTYPGDVLTVTADGPLTFPKSERAGWLLTNDPDPAPTVVDDSPAALIARLTAGDTGDDSR